MSLDEGNSRCSCDVLIVGEPETVAMGKHWHDCDNETRAFVVEEYREIIRLALDVYRASTPVTTENRRAGDIEWDREKLFAFRDFVAAKGNYLAR